jgi:hypothetical protein
MLFNLTFAYSTPVTPASPGVTTGSIGTAASCLSFASQNASKSSGGGSAGWIPAGATAAPSSTRPGPPVLRFPKLVSGRGGFTSTRSIPGSASDVSIRARALARSIDPEPTTSPPLRRIV